MAEPYNVDRFWVCTKVRMVIDGKHVKAEIKKWYDVEEKCYKEKILSHVPDSTYGAADND